jgi:hypothetical protein
MWVSHTITLVFSGFAQKRKKTPKRLLPISQAKKSHSIEWLFLNAWSGILRYRVEAVVLGGKTAKQDDVEGSE